MKVADVKIQIVEGSGEVPPEFTRHHKHWVATIADPSGYFTHQFDYYSTFVPTADDVLLCLLEEVSMFESPDIWVRPTIEDLVTTLVDDYGNKACDAFRIAEKIQSNIGKIYDLFDRNEQEELLTELRGE